MAGYEDYLTGSAYLDTYVKEDNTKVFDYMGDPFGTVDQPAFIGAPWIQQSDSLYERLFGEVPEDSSGFEHALGHIFTGSQADTTRLQKKADEEWSKRVKEAEKVVKKEAEKKLIAQAEKISTQAVPLTTKQKKTVKRVVTKVVKPKKKKKTKKKAKTKKTAKKA